MKKFPYFVTFSVLVALLTCVSFGYLLSTLIVSANLFQVSQKVESGQNTFYLLSIYSTESVEDAEEKKEEYLDTNFGCYIYQVDNTYHIIASCHNNNNDAELVKSNLKANNIEAEILKLKCDNVVLEGNFSNSEEQILKECLALKFNLFNKLYDISISLDTNVIDEVTAKLKINEVYSLFLNTKNNFETLFGEKISGEIDEIRDDFSLIEEIFLSLTTASENLSAKIKYACTELAVEV